MEAGGRGLGKWVDEGTMGSVGVAGWRRDEMVLGWVSGGLCSVLVSGSHPVFNIWTAGQAYSARLPASRTPRWGSAGMPVG